MTLNQSVYFFSGDQVMLTLCIQMKILRLLVIVLMMVSNGHFCPAQVLSDRHIPDFMFAMAVAHQHSRWGGPHIPCTPLFLSDSGHINCLTDNALPLQIIPCEYAIGHLFD